MSTFHLPPTHCSVVLMSDYVIVACLFSRTVLVSLHVSMYSQCRHTAAVFLLHPGECVSKGDCKTDEDGW